MSYLIGINYPKNNVGSLPIDLLTSNEEATATALFKNARQIHAQYSAKSALKASQLHFSRLTEFDFTREYEVEGAAAVQTAAWHELEALSEAWILESLEGMKYLQRYDWLFLRSVVTLGYIGWMLFSLTFLLQNYVLPFRNEQVHKGEENPCQWQRTDVQAACWAMEDATESKHGHDMVVQCHHDPGACISAGKICSHQFTMPMRLSHCSSGSECPQTCQEYSKPSVRVLPAQITRCETVLAWCC